MIDHNARIDQVVKTALKDNALGEAFGYAIGHGFGPIPVNEQGEMAITAYWVITLTTKSSLLGYPDIAKSVPIPGTMPADGVVSKVVAAVVEACRQERAQQLGTPE